MYVIIEQILDGSWDSVDLIGAYKSFDHACTAMHNRASEVIADYQHWRGYPFDPEYTITEPAFACRGYDGEGEVLRWFVFDTDNPTTSYGVHKEG